MVGWHSDTLRLYCKGDAASSVATGVPELHSFPAVFAASGMPL
jgi:hypothetical protein